MPAGFVVPEKLRDSGGFGGRQNIGRRWFRFLRFDAGLKPDGSVLDVGCGLGRVAAPLMKYLTGRYEGFDVDAEAIAWCKENITSQAPHFRFQTVNLQSGRYNPDGRAAAETFAFPYESNAFDVVFLASVFTHLLTPAVANYLREIHRVLKPGGRVVASYFLLNEGSEKAIAAKAVRNERHLFVHPVGECKVWKPDVPEAGVAHDEKSLRALYESAGLRVLDVRYGKWWGHSGKRQSNQDMIFALKP